MLHVVLINARTPRLKHKKPIEKSGVPGSISKDRIGLSGRHRARMRNGVEVAWVGQKNPTDLLPGELFLNKKRYL